MPTLNILVYLRTTFCSFNVHVEAVVVAQAVEALACCLGIQTPPHPKVAIVGHLGKDLYSIPM